MREKIKAELKIIEGWLPHQGPIGVFIHQNTLGAFENQPFWQAVETSAEVRGADPYMPHSWYLEALERGRIKWKDCTAILKEIENQSPRTLDSDPSLVQIHAAALRIPKLFTSDETIQSLLQFNPNGNEPNLKSDQTLWNLVLQAVSSLNLDSEEKQESQMDSLHPSDEILIQLAAVFLDNGISYWPMPVRQRGFYSGIRKLLLTSESRIPSLWQWFSPQSRRLFHEHQDPLSLIAEIMRIKSISDPNRLNFLRAEALKLPGWAGTFATLGHRTDTKGPKTNLAEYLAIRLLLQASEEIKVTTTSAQMPAPRLWIAREILLVLKQLQFSEENLQNWPASKWQFLYNNLTEFGDITRRRILHQAYERFYVQEILGAIKSKNPKTCLDSKTPFINKVPELQAVFCIDEREESMRRLLEETAPQFETFGAAGFFGLDMCFKSPSELESVPLCPPVIQPKHVVIEHPRSASKTNTGKFNQWVHESSRRVVGGSVLAQTTGLFSMFPLASRVFLPGLGGKHLLEPQDSDLEFEYSGRCTEGGLQIGYTISEMTDRVEGILRGMGLSTEFAPFVVFIGHGSQSLNNPHESAHDCGACGGRRGAPNSRVFARMANHPKVRGELRKRGILIPEQTWFIGAYHDTCSDGFHFFDLDFLPDTLMSLFNAHRKIFDRARALNAAERCRRFSISNRAGAEASLKHVESRSADLRQPRPEYGHATNAALVVGRRELTRDLFLDRRSFLLSYNPTQDLEGKILGRLLAAVIPVCSGISLEYYFSYVDNEIYGCGTKLPHNVVGLLGVMNGTLSDLRTGLPLQMVEIHEPMRLVVLVESTPEIMSVLLTSQPKLAQLVNNEWIQLHIRDFNSGLIYHRKDFQWQELNLSPAQLAYIDSSEKFTHGRKNPLSPIFVLKGAAQ